MYFKGCLVKIELGIGKGKKLYDKREDIAKKDAERRIRLAECVNITLEVRVSNTVAINLYKSCGFEIAATRKRYYENGEDAYLMLKEF